MRLTLKSAQLICALTLTTRQYAVAELLFRETMRHLSAECCCGGWSCGSLLPRWSLHYHNLPRPQISRHHNLKHFISTIDCVIIPINRTLQDWLLGMNVIVVVSCDTVTVCCGSVAPSDVIMMLLLVLLVIALLDNALLNERRQLTASKWSIITRWYLNSLKIHNKSEWFSQNKTSCKSS